MKKVEGRRWKVEFVEECRTGWMWGADGLGSGLPAAPFPQVALWTEVALAHPCCRYFLACVIVWVLPPILMVPARRARLAFVATL